MLGKDDVKLLDRLPMRYALLITVEDGDQRVAGTIRLAKGRITGKARCGFQRLMESALVGTHFIDGGTASVTATSDPLRWIQALPENYNGTYLRAKKLEETPPARPGSDPHGHLKRKPGRCLPRRCGFPRASSEDHPVASSRRREVTTLSQRVNRRPSPRPSNFRPHPRSHSLRASLPLPSGHRTNSGLPRIPTQLPSGCILYDLVPASAREVRVWRNHPPMWRCPSPCRPGKPQSSKKATARSCAASSRTRKPAEKRRRARGTAAFGMMLYLQIR
jgi:hypothetical protein